MKSHPSTKINCCKTVSSVNEYPDTGYRFFQLCDGRRANNLVRGDVPFVSMGAFACLAQRNQISCRVGKMEEKTGLIIRENCRRSSCCIGGKLSKFFMDHFSNCEISVFWPFCFFLSSCCCFALIKQICHQKKYSASQSCEHSLFNF